MSDWSCDGWEAIYDAMPGKPHTLRITATCHAPRTGYRFDLQPQAPQGINPRDLLLHLVVQESDAGNEVLTDVPVEYSLHTDQEYDTISIVPGGPAGIPVQIVRD
ncbi:MAG: hypothetical protein QOF55_349 [Thermoleophilaceae bacterium]|nr:hypothetical protein [Thermoleophilaceae bacterium]